jgi:hypothetical protein
MKAVYGGALVGWVAIASIGCEHAQVRVTPPAAIPQPEAENDLVVARYRGMVGPHNGKGVIAVQITNKTEKPITIRGEQGGPIPTKNDQRAWLVYRDNEDLKSYLQSDLSLKIDGPDATLTMDVPKDGVIELEPRKSTMVLVAFSLTPAAEDLSFDLSPVVCQGNCHDADGHLRALYLTVPMKDRPTIVKQAKDYLNNTNFGINLTSDDLMQ